MAKVLAMNILGAVTPKVFHGPICAILRRSADRLRTHNPEIYIMDDEELVAYFEANFSGNIGKQETLKLKRFIKQQSDDAQRQHLKEETKRRLELYFNEIEDKLTAAEDKLDAFQKTPHEVTWTEFTASMTVWEEAKTLRRKIEHDSATKLKLLQNFDAYCEGDLSQYGDWQINICLIFLRVYNLRLNYHYYTTFSDATYDKKVLTAGRGHLWSVAFEPYAENEMLDMEKQSSEVVKLMDKNLAAMKMHFLIRRCGDPLHENCGAKTDEHCCELNAAVYQHLRNRNAPDNLELAKGIATALENKYGHFRWSAMVFSGHHRVCADYKVNDIHAASVWFHRFGSEIKQGDRATIPLTSLTPNREQVVMNDGRGTYGIAVCYKSREQSAKTAVVFWVDPSVLESQAAAQAYDRVLALLEPSTEAAAALATKDIHAVLRMLKDGGEDYVFGVGVGVNQGTIGLHRAITNGDRGFPMRIFSRDITSCVALWPVSRPTNTSIGCELIQVGNQLQTLVMTAQFGSICSQSNAQLKSQSRAVAVHVKELEISRKDDERKTQIASLNAGLQRYKKLNHENVARYFGFQVVPAVHLESPKYQIVSELCTGGSLTERVRAKPVTLWNNFQWSKAILEGLSYLHSHHIRHGKLRGDHVLFSGPGLGVGTIKLIFLGKAQNFIYETGRSYIPQTRRYY
ncbi:hypothetical protein BV898_08566 [Hypsibius exemplaris]|uniref:non-specific serine/threonine protein kinase n=1 Tax=Hypsibius exemplaris TaxID=2072580 RepID=A0A1W0WQ94_HYPEX|nr:hypothetical protein BV898_08566 [Hypsibius exemplaris]